MSGERKTPRFSLADERVQAFQAAALAADKAWRAKNTRRLAQLEKKVESARQGLQEAVRDGIKDSGILGGRRRDRA